MPEASSNESAPHIPISARRSFGHSMVALIYRGNRGHRAIFAATTIAIYCLISLMAYWPAWPGDPHLMVGGAVGDPVQASWFLGWTPWAILHGHNPFLTNWIDYPNTVNLTVNTAMPLLGLITWPVTYIFGPAASFSLLLSASYPVSAAAAFFVLRRWTSSNYGAFVGALMYGFSPYLIDEGIGHLNLVFVPLPPILFLLVYEILVVQKAPPIRLGLLLGLVTIMQYLISSEILATTALMCIIGLVILALFRRHEVTKQRFIYAIRAFMPAIGISAVVLAVPLYYLFDGPSRWNGPAFAINNGFRADLLGPVTPTSSQILTTPYLASISDKFAENLSENGSYLGIPLIALLVFLVIRLRSNRWVTYGAVMAIMAFILSLGPRLVIDGSAKPILLPFRLLVHLPLVDNVLPSRISLYVAFFVATIIALSIASAFDTSRDKPKLRRSSQFLVGCVGIVSLISLLPAWPIVSGGVTVPSFYSSNAANEIPKGSVVLSFPFPAFPYDQAMLWQADANWRWKLVGGYALVASSGSASAAPTYLAPIDIEYFLEYWSSPYPLATPSAPAPVVTPQLVLDLRTYILQNHISAVIYTSTGANPAMALSLFTKALGHPDSKDGVDYWLDMQERFSRTTSLK